MKKAIYTVLLAATWLSACNKQSAVPTDTANTATADADFTNSKAVVRSSQLKTSEAGLTIDYDFIIKEIAPEKYAAAIRLNGVRLNGNKVNGVKFNGSQSVYKAIVIGINTTKEDAPAAKAETSFAILLDGAKADKNGDVIVFDPFTFKGDIVNDVIDVTVKLTIGGGSVVIIDNATINIGGSDISVKQYSNIILTGGNVVMTDESSFFVVPNGRMVVQNPVVAKSKIRPDTKPGETVGEADGKVVVTVSGDPADWVTGITYEPAPVALDPNKPDVLTKMPVMKFVETHYNKQTGLHRFVSTETWSALYGRPSRIGYVIGDEAYRIQQVRRKFD